MSKIECKVCNDGNLEAKEVRCFPDLNVLFLAKMTLWVGWLGIFLSVLLVALVIGTSFDKLEAPAFVGLGLLIGFPMVSLLVALIGAIFSMKKPVLRCSNCTAVVRAS